jgi:hypothetical protein
VKVGRGVGRGLVVAVEVREVDNRVESKK